MAEREKIEIDSRADRDGNPVSKKVSNHVSESEDPDVSADNVPANAQAKAAAQAAPRPDLETVIAQRDQTLAEKAEILERFQRAQAEFENARKHLLRQKQEAQEYAGMESIRSLLSIVDDFERARKAPGLDPEFRKGLDLIHEQMMEVFTRAGLQPVDEEGKFNPHFHHAVDRGLAESDEQDQNILEVYQRGYHFKDRLLRPAMVKVAIKEEN